MNDEELYLLDNVVLEPKSKSFERNFKKSDVKSYVENRPSESLHLIAVCLNRFAQLNFVGPKDVHFDWTPSLEDSDSDLEVDGESPYCKSEGLDYLKLAKWFAVDNGEGLRKKFPTVDLWSLRVLFLWQKLLPDKVEIIKRKCLESIKRSKDLLSVNEEKFKITTSLLYAEMSNVYLFYYEYKLAENCLASALELSNLNVQMSGALGRKTKFQQTDVAQLVLQIEGIENGKAKNVIEQTDPPSLPTDCRLNDDTLLDKINFTEPRNDPSTLSPSDHCVLLAAHNLSVRSKAVDVLSDEESSAYLDKLLENPQIWVVQVSALLARCRLEMNRRRKVERCLSQLEELVQNFNDISKGDAVNRLKYFFACDSTPIWMIEKLLADVMVRLGATRSALEIYLRLRMWTETVTCYKHLDMLDRAESLIRDRLAEGETPAMLCLLGDITMHEDYYHKAWDLSKGRYAEAKKRLGFLYFNRKMYEKATESFREATRLQPLQKDTWFTLGHCAVQINRHDIAIEAYRRCVNIDGDDFESWNNLAASYVQLDRKEQAFLILLEALKCNYENWRIWDNMILLGADVGRFDECVKGLHRLLDLKDKYYDANVLSVLVDAATASNPGSTDYLAQPASKLKPDLKTFFGRLTASVPGDPRLWRLYADLCRPDSELEHNGEIEYEKYLNFLRKAYGTTVQKPGWEKTVDECVRVSNDLEKMSEACLKYVEFLSDDSKKAQAKGPVRLALKSAVGTLQKFYEISGDGRAVDENIDGCLKKLKHYLNVFD